MERKTHVPNHQPATVVFSSTVAWQQATNDSITAGWGWLGFPGHHKWPCGQRWLHFGSNFGALLWSMPGAARGHHGPWVMPHHFVEWVHLAKGMPKGPKVWIFWNLIEIWTFSWSACGDLRTTIYQPYVYISLTLLCWQGAVDCWHVKNVQLKWSQLWNPLTCKDTKQMWPQYGCCLQHDSLGGTSTSLFLKDTNWERSNFLAELAGGLNLNPSQWMFMGWA